MTTKAAGFLCPKCKKKTAASVVKDPLNQTKGGFCHDKGQDCRHIVTLKCEECTLEHSVESAWHRRW